MKDLSELTSLSADKARELTAKGKIRLREEANLAKKAYFEGLVAKGDTKTLEAIKRALASVEYAAYEGETTSGIYLGMGRLPKEVCAHDLKEFFIITGYTAYITYTDDSLLPETLHIDWSGNP